MTKQILNKLITIKCIECCTVGIKHNECEYICDCSNLYILAPSESNLTLFFQYIFQNPYYIDQDRWSDNCFHIRSMGDTLLKIDIDKFIFLTKQKDFIQQLNKLINII